MRRLLLPLFALSLLFVLSAQAREIKSGKLTGSLKSSTYFAPNGLFHVPVPVDREVGGRVEDGPGGVTFYDDFGSLYRIDYLEMPPQFIRIRKELGDQVFLEQFLTTIYLPNTILAAIPKAQLIAQNFLSEPAGPVLQAWMLLPEGSAYVVKDSLFKSGKREDAFRALAVLIQRETLCVVSVAPAAPLVRNSPAPNQLRATVEQMALDFARSMEFAH